MDLTIKTDMRKTNRAKNNFLIQTSYFTITVNWRSLCLNMVRFLMKA